MCRDDSKVVAGRNREWGIPGAREGGASSSEHSVKISDRTGQQVIVGKCWDFFSDILNFSHTNHFQFAWKSPATTPSYGRRRETGEII